jgi:hypothetical protein
LLSLINFFKNTIIIIEEKIIFLKKLKNIRIWINKLNIIIYIINIIIEFDVVVILKTLGLDVVIRYNTFNFFIIFIKIKSCPTIYDPPK